MSFKEENMTSWLSIRGFTTYSTTFILRSNALALFNSFISSIYFLDLSGFNLKKKIKLKLSCNSFFLQNNRWKMINLIILSFHKSDSRAPLQFLSRDTRSWGLSQTLPSLPQEVLRAFITVGSNSTATLFSSQ